jgi:transcription elongation factor Elf1
MGKRLVCPACRSENTYDEPLAFMNVRCKACGRTFSAEANLYVTEEPKPKPSIELVQLTCTCCLSENSYAPEERIGDVHRHGGAARCKACGEVFNVAAPDDAHALKRHKHREVVEARVRLLAHVSKHPDYLDRDRDLLLLHLVERIDELHLDLSKITKRD